MNTRYLWIFLIILIVACGQAPDSPTVTLPVTSEQPAVQEPSKSDSVATGKVKEASDVGSAMLVASAKALPECSKDNDGQLAYAKEEGEFYSCSDLVWSAIDLRGSKGKDGKNGQNGIDGIDGKDGSKGEKGADGKTLAPVDENSWYHPVTNVKWFLGRTTTNVYVPGWNPNLLSSNYLCPTGARLPSSDEYNDALSAGIWTKLGAKQPLLIDIGSIINTSGTTQYYSFIAGKPSSGLAGQMFNGTSTGTATALCLVE